MTAGLEGTTSPGLFIVMMIITLSGTTIDGHSPLSPPLALPEWECIWTGLLALCPSTECPQVEEGPQTH